MEGNASKIYAFIFAFAIIFAFALVFVFVFVLYFQKRGECKQNNLPPPRITHNKVHSIYLKGCCSRGIATSAEGQNMLMITPTHNSCRTIPIKTREIDYHTWCFPAVLLITHCTGLLLDKKMAEGHLSFQYWVIMVMGNKLCSAICLLFSAEQGVEGDNNHLAMTMTLWGWLL